MGNLLERKNVLMVKNYLHGIDPTIKLIELKTTARTAQDAANSLNKEVGAIVKSLLFKANENKFYLCLVSGDMYLSEKKLEAFTQKNIKKATAEDVKKQTGFSIGGVSPVAHYSPPTRVFIDENLKRFEDVYSAAGHPFVVFKTKFQKLKEITNGVVVDIVK